MPAATGPNISVVVSNMNGEKYLPKLLETLRAQRGVGELQVIVVDRDSTDRSHEILAASPEVEVVTEPPETGLVAGYARGAEEARHELLFFCNEDLWLDESCLARAAELVDVERRVGSSDPWQWTYDGEHWVHGGVRFRRTPWAVTSSYPWRRYCFTEPMEAGTPIPFGCAGAVLVHRSMYDDVGGWDRSFFLDGEDVDFFLRGWQRGWRCVTAPEAKVFHAVGASNGKRVGRRKRVSVSELRYVGGRSNVSVIGLKTFSGRALWIPFFVWLLTLSKDIVRANWEWARLDLLTLRSIVRRLPAAVAHRRRHRDVIRARPGERFFRAPEFNR